MHLHNPLEQALRDVPVVRSTVVVDGTPTAVWTYGPEDASRTIVLIHGFRGTHHGLLSVVAAMPEVRFVAPDLPGFGESAPLRVEHTLDAYAAWLASFLNEVDAAGRAIVLGHSFGSLVVARNVAGTASRPVVLVNPIAANALQGPERFLTFAAIAYYRLGAVLPDPIGGWLMSAPLITRIMSVIMAKTRSRALRAWIHDQHHRYFSSFANRRVLAEAFRASVSDAVLAHAGDFAPGTVLIVGAEDAIAPLEASEQLGAAIAGSKLYVLGGVGHLIHYEAPLAVARILKAQFSL